MLVFDDFALKKLENGLLKIPIDMFFSCWGPLNGFGWLIDFGYRKDTLF